MRAEADRQCGALVGTAPQIRARGPAELSQQDPPGTPEPERLWDRPGGSWWGQAQQGWPSLAACPVTRLHALPQLIPKLVQPLPRPGRSVSGQVPSPLEIQERGPSTSTAHRAGTRQVWVEEFNDRFISLQCLPEV